ncbi:MAG: ACP S-malonyltransferase [Spirochaetaceae bacterium]|nr:ACP S-malonyltransferase [Spirochaetaceae bacterium]
MMTSILLFPGQGAQKPGMARDLYEKYSEVKELFKIAGDYSSFNAEKLLFESTEDELKETERTQVAITLANLASYEALKAEGLLEEVLGVAGFSLGEYAALKAAGVCNYEDIFTLVAERGRLMAKAGKQIIEARGAVAMAAVMGLSVQQVEEVVKSLGRDDVFCANYNSPTQLILSGLEAGINAAEPLLKEAGARRVMPLKVSGPFHTPLLNEAAAGFSEVLGKVTFNNPIIPIFSNVSGRQISSGEEARSLLAKQICNPVLWLAVEEGLKKLAAADTKVIECGPGNVLAGLWKAIFNEKVELAATTAQISELKSKN